MNEQKDIDFNMKKKPAQARSKSTVSAIIQACAQILEKDGYGALSTNEVARVAGVSIGSVYEYFPGKEAIVATMARAMLESNMDKLYSELSSKHDNDFETAMRHWIGTLFELVKSNKKILQALIFEAPYIWKLFPINNLQVQLLQVALKIPGPVSDHGQARGFVFDIHINGRNAVQSRVRSATRIEKQSGTG